MTWPMWSTLSIPLLSRATSWRTRGSVGSSGPPPGSRMTRTIAGFGSYPSDSRSSFVARSLSEELSVKPAAFRWLSTSWPTAMARIAKTATTPSTAFGCFQVRSATRVTRGERTRIQSARFVKQITPC